MIAPLCSCVDENTSDGKPVSTKGFNATLHCDIAVDLLYLLAEQLLGVSLYTVAQQQSCQYERIFGVILSNAEVISW